MFVLQSAGTITCGLHDLVAYTQPERDRRTDPNQGGSVRLHDGQVESTQSYDIVYRRTRARQWEIRFSADRPENVSTGVPGGNWAPGNTGDL